MRSSDDLKSVRQTLNISRLAIRYPRITVGFWIAVVVAGLLAFGSLRYALFPDITFPVVVVNAQVQPATSSQDTESRITIPIEKKLQSLSGLDDLISTTSPGRVSIRASFQVGTNLGTARRETEAALKAVVLPENTVLDTIPLNLNESAAVSYVIQSPSLALEQLAILSEAKITPVIKAVDGVLKVSLLGLLEGQSSSMASPGQDGAFPTLVRFNGTSSLALAVVKKSSANTLELVHAVDNAVTSLRNSLPGVQIIQASTQANYIKEASNATLESIAIAVALSVIVIYPFLWNWKATLISALAIPTSLFGTFIVMAIFGLNLETITLLAIALVVGIIVDDAIVDVENISRHLDLGESPREAAISATDEVGLTVTAATLTIAAVFIPVALMGGVVGQFFRPFGLTTSAAVLISLLVSRTLSPLLSMLWLRKSSSRHESKRWLSFLACYEGLLKWSLRHRKLVIVATCLSLALGIGLVFVVNKGFIPRLDRGEFIVRYTSEPIATPPPNPGGALQAQEVARSMTPVLLQSKMDAVRIEELVRQSPDVQDVFTTVGSQWGQPNTGELLIKLRANRSRNTLEVQRDIREKLAGLSGLITSVEDIPFVDTGSEQPLQIRLFGSNLSSLDKTAKTIKDRISTLPGLVDISTTATGQADQAGILIEHINRRRVRLVQANISPDISVDQAVALIKKKTGELLPKDVTMNFGGDSERIGEIMTSFAFTMILGVVCILAVLFFLFRSWSDPLIIVFSLPLSLVGAMVALLLTGQEFGMISVIGIIFLMGLTNKNAIIMVDYINQLRQSGLAQADAILQGATVRLRPILMTTAATILGMLPVALGLGAGSELRSPMAIAIMGGLIASSLLSLFVIPVIYSLLADINSRFSRSV
jgi:multidrug efflux pump subunit AcrB